MLNQPGWSIDIIETTIRAACTNPCEMGGEAMSLYDRFRGQDDAAKLPIWPTISTVAEILSGQITDEQAIQRFDLGSVEQAEFAQVKTHVVQKIEGVRDSLTAVGLADATATTIARAVIRNDVTQTLMRAELGYDSREEFNADLGIS